MELYDVIVIGGGPSGLTAGIYSSRANLKTLLLEGSKEPGGQLMLTTEVENYPGFPKGILGPELMKNMRDQALRFGTKIISEEAVRVNFKVKPFIVETAKEKFFSKSVIVASGARTKWLGLDGEKRLIGRGVSSCATCDAAFFRNKEVIVVGGGDSAMEESLFLTKFASKVMVIHRRDKLKASKIMQDRAMKNDKIKFFWNCEVTEILGDSKVSSVRIINNVTNKESELKCDGVFVAIGHLPNSEIFTDLEKDEKGFLKVKTVFTNIPGIFVCGDVHDYRYKQAVTAAGLGCMAAMEAEKWLESS